MTAAAMSASLRAAGRDMVAQASRMLYAVDPSGAIQDMPFACSSCPALRTPLAGVVSVEALQGDLSNCALKLSGGGSDLHVGERRPRLAGSRTYAGVLSERQGDHGAGGLANESSADQIKRMFRMRGRAQPARTSGMLPCVIAADFPRRSIESAILVSEPGDGPSASNARPVASLVGDRTRRCRFRLHPSPT